MASNDRWTGHMQTACQNDQQIHPIQFTKWAHAHRNFARGKDRIKVDELKASIARHGLTKPIKLGVDDRYRDVYVGDGHHRAVALMELGVHEFPFHWYWITSAWGHPQMERGPFPSDLLR